MAGRTPKPVEIKKLEGNPGKRELPVGPNILPGEPEPPDSVRNDPVSLIEWQRIVPELMHVNLLAKVDMGAIAAYCQAFSLWQKASESVERDGILIPGPSGVRKNPAIGIMLDAWKAVRAFASEFGLSPASRSKVSHTYRDDDGAFERFLFDEDEESGRSGFPEMPQTGPHTQ
jgi:P27 family predicted phage terminase small subunit